MRNALVRLLLICLAVFVVFVLGVAAFGAEPEWTVTEGLRPYSELLFIIGAVGGALLHYAKEKVRGQTTSSFLAYWVRDNPGNSMGSGAALLFAIFATLGSGVLQGADPWFVLQGALTTGWTLNSAFNKGAPAKSK